MLGRAVTRGAIYHASSHRRREVPIDDGLRRLVAETTDAIRAMLASERLPPPVNDRRCDECSLKSICAPAITVARTRHRAALESLFDPDAAG